MNERGPENQIPKELKKQPEKAIVNVATPQEGIALIKDFWQSMPHGRIDLTLPETDDPKEWRELTKGDRTMLFQSPPGSGKWKVMFIPNTGNNFTKEALVWLERKGLL